MRSRSFLLVLLLLSLVGCYGARRGGSAGDDRSRLVEAVADRRMLVGRAIGGFRFGTESGKKRGTTAAETPFGVLLAAADIRKRFDADASPVNTGNLALAYLLAGDAEKGVKLSEIRALSEETAESLTDLSAAYLQRATATGSFDDFARSYDAALRALHLEPKVSEAIFNQAVAAGEMGLPWLARAAWDSYLRVESEGAWADFARGSLARAMQAESLNDLSARDRPNILQAWRAGNRQSVRSIALRRPDLAREILRRSVLPAAAGAIAEDLPSAELLSFAYEMNEIAEARDRDTLDREALDLLSRGDRALGTAHVELAHVNQQLDEKRIEEASAALSHAAHVFRAKGSPYLALAELQQALVDFYSGRRQSLIHRYTLLIARHRDRYPLLRARAHWMRALCHGLVESNQWAALPDYRHSLALLTEAGQRDAARQGGSLLFATLVGLGREDDAGRVLAGVLPSLSLEEPPTQVRAVVVALTEHLRDLGLSLGALEVVRQEQLRARDDRPVERAVAALDASELATQAGNIAAANQSLNLAAHWIGQIQDNAARSEMEIAYDLARLEADPGIGADSPQATRLLTSLRERPNQMALRKALTLVGEKARAAGRTDRAEALLREGLSMHLSARALTASEFERAALFEAAERPADNLIDLLSSSGRAEEALRLMEQLRGGAASDPRWLQATVARLPKGTSLVNYWTLKDRVLATVIDASGTWNTSLPLGAAAVRRAMQLLDSAIEVESRDHLAKSLSSLYRSIFEPLSNRLQATRRLVIVADRDLWPVPFAGLARSPGEEPVASKYELVFAASIAGAVEARQGWTTPQSILAVGGADWDREVFSDLPALPESRREADDVASLYTQGHRLSGSEATAKAVQSLAPHFDVVHIASHAVTNSRDPGESFVLFAADGQGAGAWRAKDPGWNAFSEARLVVLSACGTAGQRQDFQGAASGVLRSIQRTTRAEILASVGAVDDLASRQLLRGFHTYLRAGHEPTAALRLAQTDPAHRGAGNTWMLYRIIS